jgi:hypothetical protein
LIAISRAAVANGFSFDAINPGEMLRNRRDPRCFAPSQRKTL